MSSLSSKHDDYKYYFQVEDIKIDDLYDWSKKLQKCRVHTVTRPSNARRLHRRSSSTPAGSLVDLNYEKIALFRIDDHVFAVNENCPHMGGPLHMGDIEVLPDKSLCVKCPWHNWRFHLNTGAIINQKDKKQNAVVYPTKVDENGNIWIGFNAFAKQMLTGEEDF